MRFDRQGNRLDEIVTQGEELADAGLLYPGLLIGVDGKGNLYGSAVTGFKDGKVVPDSALVQVNSQGAIVRVIERDEFPLLETTVVDEEGNLYRFHFGEVPSEPAEIWSCSPEK